MAKAVERVDQVTIRFAGDSGDGMQLTGARFTSETAVLGNDLSTLPDFPAEIRAPAGSLPGVSGFQIHFADHDILTPGDRPNVLVAMNPAALKTNVRDLPKGGTLIVNSDAFSDKNLDKAGYASNPLEDGSLADFQVHAIPLTTMTQEAVKETGVTSREADAREEHVRARADVVAVHAPDRAVDRRAAREVREEAGDRRGEHPRAPGGLRVRRDDRGLRRPVRGRAGEDGARRLPERDREPGARARARRGERQERSCRSSSARTRSRLPRGSSRSSPATSTSASARSRPRTRSPPSGAALGASFGGALGITTSSGPGIVLKQETIGLAVTLELPLVILDIQRAGPATGMPTKPEQGDLLNVMFGRNSESPVPVVAAATPGDCFDATIEACRIAIKYRTPVFMLSDAYLANGSEPWLIPDPDTIPEIGVEFATEPNQDGAFMPYLRDPETLARPWAVPGTPGLEHRIGGLEKADVTGNVSYDPDNHDYMVRVRAQKVAGIAADIPELEVDHDEGAKLLVLGWGGTYGPVTAGVRRVRKAGGKVAQAHLRHLNPFPRNLGDVLRTYDRVLIPEMNLGQLLKLVRAEFLVDAAGYNRVRGMPFTSSELAEAMESML